MSDVIHCRRCAKETNAPPDEAPKDWVGLCPSCALELMIRGEVSRPQLNFLLGQLARSLARLGFGDECDEDHEHEMSFTETGQMIGYHPREVCERDGIACPLHSPTDHHMKTWPIHVRTDLQYSLVSRMCSTHRVFHPDPDSLQFILEHDPEFDAFHDFCCGCCKERT